MAERILLINPIQKTGASRRINSNVKKGVTKMARKTRKRRSAAQIAATRKLVALNKRRGKTKRRRSRRRNPVSLARSIPRAPARRRRRNPIRRQAYRATSARIRRRNPVRRGIVDTTIIPAATATMGALGLDIAWAYLPIPDTVKVGPMKYLAKAGGAIGLSYLAGMAVSKKTAETLGVGALTVVMHQAAREFISRTMPTLAMDGMGYYPPSSMGYYNPALPAGETSSGNMGYYPNTPSAEMGYYAQQY